MSGYTLEEFQQLTNNQLVATLRHTLSSMHSHATDDAVGIVREWGGSGFDLASTPVLSIGSHVVRNNNFAVINVLKTIMHQWLWIRPPARHAQPAPFQPMIRRKRWFIVRVRWDERDIFYIQLPKWFALKELQVVCPERRLGFAGVHDNKLWLTRWNPGNPHEPCEDTIRINHCGPKRSAPFFRRSTLEDIAFPSLKALGTPVCKDVANVVLLDASKRMLQVPQSTSRHNRR
jgi:hypothetical protein